MLAIKISLILLVAVAGCNAPPSMNTVSQNDDLIVQSQLNVSSILSKDIVVTIDRGGCCYGHIIVINKNGDLQYSVGAYSVPNSNRRESGAKSRGKFDLNRIELDKKYAQKNQKVSAEVLEHLAQLVRSEEKLSFRDHALIDDAYLYHLYLDNEEIAYGYDSNIKSFPASLRELINLVIGQVELHKLPGMA